MSTFNLNTLHIDFSEIQIFNNKSLSSRDIIKHIIKTKKPEEAFYVADIGGIIKRHEEWINKMPRVIPYYAVTCNTNSTVIKVLAALNAYFSCVSKEEIAQVMQHNVPGERIIFAHPSKWRYDIKYAKKKGVKQMIADNKWEIQKIKNFFPKAEIVLRIRCGTENSPNVKFGCNPKETEYLIRYMQDIGLNLHGFSFHIETHLGMEAYIKGIRTCERLIAIAQNYGHYVQMIDIGGGFPSKKSKFNELVNLINNEIMNVDPRIRIISEPGRYFVESNFILVSRVKSKKLVMNNNRLMMYYYMACGVHNSFLAKILAMQVEVPEILFTEHLENRKQYLSNIWGPTTDCFDLILQNVLMPDLRVGSWLIWKNMGFQTLAFSNTFNGFPIPTVKPFIRKENWKNFVTKYLGGEREEETQNQ